MRKFILGLGMGLILTACASFDYNVFVLRYKEGKLNSKDPKNDLPISICDDTPQSKANCYVLLRADYIQVRSDFIEMQRRLKACEKR